MKREHMIEQTPIVIPTPIIHCPFNSDYVDIINSITVPNGGTTISNGYIHFGETGTWQEVPFYSQTTSTPYYPILAPLTEDAVDIISGNAGTIIGNNNATYSANGLHFRGAGSTSGVQYIDWNYGSHQVPVPSLTQSMTFLCDFYNDSTSGHNAILVFQKNTSSRFVSIVYNNRRWAVEKIGSGNVVAQLNQSISTNTWYNNSGFSWDANEKKLHLILNGEIKATSSVSSLPDYSNAQIRIGWADGSSDYFKGYLRNIRFYDKNYTIEMNM